MIKIKDRQMFFTWVWIWAFILWEIALIVLFILGFAKDFGNWLNPSLTKLLWSIIFYPALFLFAFFIVVKPLAHLCGWLGRPKKV